ncbi:Copine-2 [Orchesella cincta]|uniref:Copine-2 n=1 Tax=Orchesella cincta TaxID=48709 RepID=A0A1D2MHX4_ORCCI|nr:Copine-2 [Orchesella cincta]
MLLKFWVSGRGLLDKGISGSTTDPYYILFLSEDGGKTKTEIGRSDTITNQLNPDWTNVFEIKIDRTKNQYLYFYVLDKNSNPEDPHITLGRVWLNVDDYVKKGQNDSINLDKAGYLIITNADGAVGSGMLRMPYGPYGTPDKQTLKFKISAKGLPTRLQIKICDDDLLHSDHSLGQVWMQLNDYVAKEELHTVLLPTKG